MSTVVLVAAWIACFLTGGAAVWFMIGAVRGENGWRPFWGFLLLALLARIAWVQAP